MSNSEYSNYLKSTFSDMKMSASILPSISAPALLNASHARLSQLRLDLPQHASAAFAAQAHYHALASPSITAAMGSAIIPPRVAPAPSLAPSDHNIIQTSEILFEGVLITSFNIGGEPRLCLPQIFHSVLTDFDLTDINRTCEVLRIHCFRCTNEQLETFKCLGILPPGAPSCGLITLTDAERLIDMLLVRCYPISSLPVTEKDLELFTTINIFHECFGKTRGKVFIEMYDSPNAVCIRCDSCENFFAPTRFVVHQDRQGESSLCHWGFRVEAWRNYIHLSGSENDDNIKLKLRLLRKFQTMFEPSFRLDKHKYHNESLFIGEPTFEKGTESVFHQFWNTNKLSRYLTNPSPTTTTTIKRTKREYDCAPTSPVEVDLDSYSTPIKKEKISPTPETRPVSCEESKSHNDSPPVPAVDLRSLSKTSQGSAKVQERKMDYSFDEFDLAYISRCIEQVLGSIQQVIEECEGDLRLHGEERLTELVRLLRIQQYKYLHELHYKQEEEEGSSHARALRDAIMEKNRLAEELRQHHHVCLPQIQMLEARLAAAVAALPHTATSQQSLYPT